MREVNEAIIVFPGAGWMTDSPNPIDNVSSSPCLSPEVKSEHSANDPDAVAVHQSQASVLGKANRGACNVWADPPNRQEAGEV